MILAPAAVQGPEAPSQLAAGLRRLNQFVEPDLILLARGGGSLEDLASFNSEKLARAIVASRAPVVCGVGHETDFTIADFAADLRAPTPTAAAELATPDKEEMAATLAEAFQGLARNLLSILREQRWTLQAAAQRLERHSPLANIIRGRQRLDDYIVRSERALQQRSRLLRSRLNGAEARLAALNPAAVLERGYAVVSKQDGSVVRQASQVKQGEELKIKVSDGQFGARVDGNE